MLYNTITYQAGEIVKDENYKAKKNQYEETKAIQPEGINAKPKENQPAKSNEYHKNVFDFFYYLGSKRLKNLNKLNYHKIK